jgi:GNAT superfamily N-acetyltransferase
VTSVDEVQIVHTIVLAFADDPVARWCWPNAHQYLANMPAFTMAFGGAAFGHQGAHCTSDYCGAALWLPPGAYANEKAIGQIIEDSVAATIRGEVYALFEQMAKYHPSQPHWYLPLIGVDPAHQRKGHGAALLAMHSINAIALDAPRTLSRQTQGTSVCISATDSARCVRFKWARRHLWCPC